MDPSNGASTWAFGNHKCVKYIGIFTRKAIISGRVRLCSFIIMNENVNDEILFIIIISTIKGRDARIVYKVK